MAKYVKPSSIRRDGLVGERLLNNSALDSNDGTKNNGTATNVTYDATQYMGYQKYVGSFNGSSSKVTVPDNIGLDFGTGDFTINFWVKPSASQTKDLINQYSPGSGTGWYLSQISDDKLQWGIYNGGSGEFAKTTNTFFTISSGQMITVIRRNSGTILDIYKDSVFIESFNITSRNINNTNTLNIGTNSTVNGGFYNGYMSGVRVFNRAISLDEIQTLYKEGKRQLNNDGFPALFSGCVGYWDFRGDANDVIGGNNGTVTGATLTTDYLGNPNSAYTFNGTSNKIDVPNLGFGTQSPRTVITYAKFDTDLTGTTFGRVIYNQGGNAAAGQAFHMWHNYGNTVNRFAINYDSATAYVDKSFNNGDDVFFAATYNGNSSVPSGATTININGVNQSLTYSGSATASIQNTNYSIGYYRTSPNFYFKNKIYYILIFNRALSEAELNTIYQITSKTRNFYPFM